MTETGSKAQTEQVTGGVRGAEPVSQGRLIWRRFKHHRMGLFGSIVVILFYLIFVGFAEFIAPYHYNQEHRDFGYIPPMITRIRFWDKDGNFSFKPFVYGLAQAQVYLNTETGEQTTKPPEGDPRYFRQPGIFWWEEDTSRKCYVEFFVRGEEYRFWDLWKTDLHLFGVREAGAGPMGKAELAASPCQLFLFGTNKLGYDIFSMTLIGGKISLAIGPLVIALAFILGILLGGISGYYGGGVDTFIQRVIEVFMALPRLALLLALAVILSQYKLSGMAVFWGIVFILIIVSWAPLARVVRGQFLALREAEFVTAARAIGVSDLRVILKHILPNTTSYLVVAATLTIPNIIILESTLSFLRLGIRDPLTSWGVLMQAGWSTQVIQNYPWFLIPGIFIVLAVLAFNFMGDALRDAVDPFTVTGAKEELA
ncbi:MAG: ABC transporter permease [Candidatus Bipolaricaulota bacterium]|nr:ABC transporter permease [Candidatus Bipolaricaulota bacterium]MDW8140807.1 ABC transporter permease [Candidatus Bipolaricaulota bacterium]